jgi:hypothetical protein
MRGELINVWSETRREIWDPLFEQPVADYQDGIPIDVFCDLYRVLAPALKAKPSIEALADALGDPIQSREEFDRITAEDIVDEPALVGFFESAHDALVEFGGDDLSNNYFRLLTVFVDKFSLRYDLRRPCVLCPTLPGLFANLVRNLRALTSQDQHLDTLMKDFENAVRDLRHDSSAGRIKTCIQKQVNLIEALGRAFPGVTGTTLGAICDQVGTWPHAKLKDAMKNLYGFASDYPGIRHSGTPANAIRAVDMRDMVAMSILLTGFTPYLEQRLSAAAIFGGSTTVAVAIAPQQVVAAADRGPGDDGLMAWIRSRVRRLRA